jgi:hypothetical protein
VGSKLDLPRRASKHSRTAAADEPGQKRYERTRNGQAVRCQQDFGSFVENIFVTFRLSNETVRSRWTKAKPSNSKLLRIRRASRRRTLGRFDSADRQVGGAHMGRISSQKRQRERKRKEKQEMKAHKRAERKLAKEPAIQPNVISESIQLPPEADKATTS